MPTGTVCPFLQRFQQNRILPGTGHHQNQLFHQIRIIRSEMLGNHAAHGDAHQRSPLNPQFRHSLFQIPGHIPCSMTLWQLCLPAEYVHRIVPGQTAVIQRQGQCGAFGGTQAISQTRQHNECFLSCSETNIVRAGSCTVFRVKNHSRQLEISTTLELWTR